MTPSEILASNAVAIVSTFIFGLRPFDQVRKFANEQQNQKQQYSIKENYLQNGAIQINWLMTN